MTLLVMIFALVMQRYLNLGHEISRSRWIIGYLNWMQGIFKRTAAWGNIFGTIILILPIVIIVAVLQWLLTGWLLMIVRFFLDLAILWFCLDAYPIKQRLAEYFSALVNHDATALHQHSEKFLSGNNKAKNGHNLTGLARAVTCEIFLRVEERIFGILFWFVILGPAGAVIYFLISIIRSLASTQNSPYVELLEPSNKIFAVIDWIPARLLGLSFALVGHFISGFNYWRKNVFTKPKADSDFVVQAGFASLNMEHIDVIHADVEENHAAVGLAERSIFLWVVVVAIFTLGGWIK